MTAQPDPVALIEAGALAAEAATVLAWSGDPHLVAAAAAPLITFILECTSAVDLRARSLAVSGQLAAARTAAVTGSDQSLQGAERFTAAARERYKIITAALQPSGYARIHDGGGPAGLAGRQLWIMRTILLSLTAPGESGPGLEWERIVADARGYAASFSDLPGPAEYDALLRAACSAGPGDGPLPPAPDAPGYDADTGPYAALARSWRSEAGLIRAAGHGPGNPDPAAARLANQLEGAAAELDAVRRGAEGGRTGPRPAGDPGTPAPAATSGAGHTRADAGGAAAGSAGGAEGAGR